MRFLVKVSFPVEAGNAAAKKDGFKVIQTILEQQKPEAAYFIADGGRRTGLLIIDITDASDIPRIAEPWFLGSFPPVSSDRAGAQASPSCWPPAGRATRRAAGSSANGALLWGRADNVWCRERKRARLPPTA